MNGMEWMAEWWNIKGQGEANSTERRGEKEPTKKTQKTDRY
jgi:hypothetical protein